MKVSIIIFFKNQSIILTKLQKLDLVVLQLELATLMQLVQNLVRMGAEYEGNICNNVPSMTLKSWNVVVLQLW